jgi:hypothetical protein
MVKVQDEFLGESRNAHWNRLAAGSAWVEESFGLKLSLRNAPSGRLSVAQIDDYIDRPRSDYLWLPPLIFKLKARVSHASGDLMGTAGFGFWNNMAPMWGNGMEVNPNWIWFYYASPQSTISLTRGLPNGWKVSAVNGGRGGERSMATANTFMRIPLLGRLFSGVRMPAREKALDNWDFTQWHEFEIHWLPEAIHFRIDGDEVLAARVKVDIPLAFIAWIDNNFASVKPNGEFEVGNLAIEQEQSLMIQTLEISQG